MLFTDPAGALTAGTGAAGHHVPCFLMAFRSSSAHCTASGARRTGRVHRAIEPSSDQELLVLKELGLDAVRLPVIAQLAQKPIVPAEELEEPLAGL